MNLIAKWRTTGGQCPPVPRLQDVAHAWIGGLVAIAAVAWLAQATGYNLILGSFGASCVLLFGFPDSPFSQPRNVIGGHVLASFIGLLFLMLFGPHWWSIALATSFAIAAMLLTRTTHPPAGSNPVIVMVSAPAWSFLGTPTLAGALVLVTVALVVNNLPKTKTYPRYWV